MFDGFSKESIKFLKELRANNNKPWFEEHRNEYEKFLLEPLRNLVTSLSESMMFIDCDFEVRPSIDKTISRIYRDVRFSKNKRPYRSSLWLKFRRPGTNRQDTPSYFFEISPEGYRFGMGYHNATPKTMGKFRDQIDEKQSEFEKAISFYTKGSEFILVGDKYKRIFDNTKPERIQNWYQRKDFHLECSRNIDDLLFSKDLVSDLILNFDELKDFYKFLLKLKR